MRNVLLYDDFNLIYDHYLDFINKTSAHFILISIVSFFF